MTEHALTNCLGQETVLAPRHPSTVWSLNFIINASSIIEWHSSLMSGNMIRDDVLPWLLWTHEKHTMLPFFRELRSATFTDPTSVHGRI
jgi:hypothetical protein